MGLITTKDAAKEAVEKAIDAMNEIGKAACRPIYRGTQEHLEQWGSGTFLEIGGADYFVTAAHVLDGHKEAGLFIGQNGLQPIELDLSATVAPDGNRECDKFDFAFAKVDQNWRELGIKPLIFDPMRLYDCQILSAFGWPNSRNRQRSINKVERSIRPTCRQFVSGGVSASASLQREGFSDQNHVIMHRSKYGVVEGRKVRNFEPKGMSGGIIFGLPNAHKPEVLAGQIDAKVVPIGIVIEKNADNKALIGTRISVIAEAIAKRA